MVGLATQIGEAVESELYSLKLKKGQKEIVAWKHRLAQAIVKSSECGVGKLKGKGLNMRLMKLVDDVKLTNHVKVKIGAALISLLLRMAKLENGKPAFRHFSSYLSRNRLAGQIELDSELFSSILPEAKGTALPRYLPMVVPPKKWNNKKGIGCYWILKASLMRTSSNLQLKALSQANIEKILESLNYLGHVPWRINQKMLHTIQDAYNTKKLTIGSLPSQVNEPLPSKESFYRMVPKSSVVDGKLVFTDPHNVPPSPSSISTATTTTTNNNTITNNDTITNNNTTTNANTIVTASNDINTTTTTTNNNTNESHDNTDTEMVQIFDEKQYKKACKRVTVNNANLHSLRCDLQIKLKIAKMFEDDRIYFPYSIDFRGRAYPVPPNLNHLGSDLCRGLLMFDLVKPLGPNGLMWLKIHLANLFGHNKISHTDRAAWCDEHINEIRDSAMNPLDGSKWWIQAEEPFQALATCIEIINATDCPEGHDKYLCGLPVHQDGSCNGLQHYAALGKDADGGKGTYRHTYTNIYLLTFSKLSYRK